MIYCIIVRYPIFSGRSVHTCTHATVTEILRTRKGKSPKKCLYKFCMLAKAKTAKTIVQKTNHTIRTILFTKHIPVIT